MAWPLSKTTLELRDAVSGAVLVYTVAENGDETHLTFTTAQLATFRTQADTLLALIG